MTGIRPLAAALLAALLTFGGLAASSGLALAQATRIVAIVNDVPVTELDLTARIALLQIIDDRQVDKKQALATIIDDAAKMTEIKRYNLVPSDAELKDRIKRIAGNLKLSVDALYAKLKEKGISEADLKYYLQASMGFTRIIQGKNQQDMKATPAEIDAKEAEIKSTVGQQMAKIMSDPRMKGITVFKLMEIVLPVDGSDPGLLQARAADAIQVAQRFKGCGSLKAASKGVFDVRAGKTFEADASKLPPQMKAALEKAGVGRAVGPMRGKGGLQLIALCDVRKVSPPKPDFKMPTRDQVERMVLNEKFDKLEQNYLVTLRGNVYVEYRDPSYATQ